MTISETCVLDWRGSAQQKRDAVNKQIPESWRFLEPLPHPDARKDVTDDYVRQFLSLREVEITETDAVEIVEYTTSGKWKSREVAEAFCHRAALAHQMVNCLHEIFFDAAIADAQMLDDYFEEHKKPFGPLHGLPVSLKDQFHIKGVETTMGYVGWIGTFEGKTQTGKEKVFESEMVRELRQLGAVLFCKTSVPHTLMAGETINNIIGYTWNPKNRFLSAGGSSGGEGALIRLRGSPIGLGTDIGGSVRIPACFNGLYGLKPSGGRLPYEGAVTSMDGQNSVLSVIGPMATSAGALRLLMKSILSLKPWKSDPMVTEIPWRDQIEQDLLERIRSKERLSFGILRHDGLSSLHPPVKRALELVVAVLERLGHQVIEWKPPSHARGLEILLTTWKYDGGRDIHRAFALSGEPIAPQISGNYGTEPFREMTASEIAATNITKRAYQKEYMDYWNSTASLTETGKSVDAVITPLAPFAAARPGMYDYHGYSFIANVLDYSTTVIPVTTVDKKVDVIDTHYQPISQVDERVWKSYDPEIYDGAHVGVQVMGRRFQEEKILVLSEMIGKALEKDCVQN